MLRTERLLISPLTAADLPLFVAYRRDEEVARYQSWSPEFSYDDGETLVATQPTTVVPTDGQWLQLALRRSGEFGPPTLIGDVAMGADPHQPDTYELGITLAREHQKSGYALEALTAVIDWLMRDQSAHRIVMQGDARNTAVLALMRRLGLRHEATVLEGDWFKGEWTTLERYALLRREWIVRAS